MFGSYAFIFGFIYLIAHKFYLVKMEKIRLRRKSGKNSFTYLLFVYINLIPLYVYITERVASIISCGGKPDEDEPNERYIIPPDMMKGRRMSCF